MSSITIPQNIRIWNQVIKETLQTSSSPPYGDLSDDDIIWGTKIWMSYYENLSENPKTLYRSLILANRTIRISKFAIIFNTKIYLAIKNRNETDFLKIFLNPEFPEVNNNPNLTPREIKIINDNIDREMYALNLAIEERLGKLESSTFNSTFEENKIINSDSHSTCYKEVCLAEIGNTPSLPKDSVKFLTNKKDCPVFVSEKIDSKISTYVWCFNLLDLVRCLALKLNNPHTDAPFSEKTLKMLRGSYRIEILLYLASQ